MSTRMLTQLQNNLFKTATTHVTSSPTFNVLVNHLPKAGFNFFPKSFLHTSPIAPGNCWSCQRILHDCVFFCDCGKIQEVDSTCNYFQLFGYEGPVANVDRTDLSDRMKAFQRKLHPDKHVRATPHEMHLAADASSLINLAYATLQSPEDRFEYMLHLKGFQRPADALHEDRDLEFLSCIMDLNEDVQRICDSLLSIGAAGDSFPDELYHLTVYVVNDVAKNIDELYQQVSSHLENAEWEKANTKFSQFRYFLRILDRLRDYQIELNKLNIHLPTIPQITV